MRSCSARAFTALEDNALDLLYPTAQDELRDVLAPSDERGEEAPARGLNARFYRFLDGSGAVIPPPGGAEVGELLAEEEAQLQLRDLPNEQQTGYLLRNAGPDETVEEVVTMPIFSTENGEVIAALVIGFRPFELGGSRSQNGIESGIWIDSRVHLPAMSETAQRQLGAELRQRTRRTDGGNTSFQVKIGDAPYLLFYKQLNLGGFAVSHFASGRLSVPVAQLAVKSEQDRAEKNRAQAALELTSEELQRSARFSADASHQLKTPVTVLRAGIEELLSRDDFSPEVYHKLSALLHQTYRITNVVDDLLLLSRMDAGRLQIQFGTVNLSQLMEEWVDDLSALPDELHVKLKTNFPPNLFVAGEKRFITLIVQNLLENARKYNRPHGSICLAAEQRDEFVVLTIENNGRPIPPAARDHIFERFHRGGMGENVPGHGLGLNLAPRARTFTWRDLRLLRSDEEWTEFEVRFRVAQQPAVLAEQA